MSAQIHSEGRLVPGTANGPSVCTPSGTRTIAGWRPHAKSLIMSS